MPVCGLCVGEATHVHERENVPSKCRVCKGGAGRRRISPDLSRDGGPGI